MSIHTITIMRCDGCHQETDDLADTKIRPWDERRFDLCDDCADKDLYICRKCWRVHGDDDDLCPDILRAKQAMSEQHAETSFGQVLDGAGDEVEL